MKEEERAKPVCVRARVNFKPTYNNEMSADQKMPIKMQFFVEFNNKNDFQLDDN